MMGRVQNPLVPLAYPPPPPYAYPPTVLMGHGGVLINHHVRDPTVTTAASGSEGEGSSSFGHGYGSGNEWYINREYQQNVDEDSDDRMKRSGSVSRFLVRFIYFFLSPSHASSLFTCCYTHTVNTFSSSSSSSKFFTAKIQELVHDW